MKIALASDCCIYFFLLRMKYTKIARMRLCNFCLGTLYKTVYVIINSPNLQALTKNKFLF